MKNFKKILIFIVGIQFLLNSSLSIAEVKAQDTLNLVSIHNSKEYTILISTKNYSYPPKSIWHADGSYSGYLYYEGTVFTGLEWKYRYSGYLRKGSYVPNKNISEIDTY